MKKGFRLDEFCPFQNSLEFLPYFCTRKLMVKIGNIELTDFPLLLAPMEDVSDPPFRFVCKKHGADLMYTEFISSEGLIRDAIKSRQKLDIFDYEKPIGIQIFGGDEEAMALATQVVDATNPDLVDINFGCPVKKVVCKGAGAGILKDVPKMLKLAQAVVKSTKLPVTVKTRLGWDENSINVMEVAERLQDVGVQALTIHGRTRSQMYKGTADWTLIGDIKNNPRIKIPIFGNGDVATPEKALELKNKYGVDGIMIGRASIGYPWIFNEIKHFLESGTYLPKPEIADRVEVCKIHLKKSIEWKGEMLGMLEMRRHYSNYFKNLPDFKSYRTTLVSSQSPSELFETLEIIKEKYSLEIAA
jgi:tRNA-dihydrouridine synthase B